MLNAYQDLKHALARDSGDLTAYTASKREFVLRVLRSKGTDLA